MFVLQICLIVALYAPQVFPEKYTNGRILSYTIEGKISLFLFDDISKLFLEISSAFLVESTHYQYGLRIV